uniref:Vimentin-like n=1 Tax=Callorhinchus milii TaxID=7868 RepID=A0A4W3JBH3_CALMI
MTYSEGSVNSRRIPMRVRLSTGSPGSNSTPTLLFQRSSIQKSIRTNSPIARYSSASLGSKRSDIDMADFSLVDGFSSEYKATRTNEKEEMTKLNNRFANFIDKVRLLEQQNKILSAELEQWKGKGSSKIGDLYEQELRDVRHHLDQTIKEKAKVQLERENLIDDLKKLRSSLQDEIQQRQEAETMLSDFREDVDEAALSCVDLQRKVDSLQEDIAFLKKLHEEEIHELQGQVQNNHIPIEMTLAKPDLSAALRDVRSQFENLAAKNVYETEEWYKSKLTDLTDSASRNNDALRLSKQENSESRRQVQALTSEINGLRGTNESLEHQMREMEERFSMEANNYQDNISQLEEDIHNLKDEMSRHLQEYQDLLNVKMALDIEIATYRKLLEGEETRIAGPIPSFSSLSFHDSTYEHQPMLESKKRITIKTFETQDGDVLSETTQRIED